MFQLPDTETLRLCSVLSSTAFGLVFALVRFERGGESYRVHWSASALLYAAVQIAFEYAPGHPVFKAALLALLAATNMLIVSGLRAFDGKPPFPWWMALPVVACFAVHLAPSMLAGGHPRVALVTQVGDTLSVAIAALIAGVACLSDERRGEGRSESQRGHARESGAAHPRPRARRLAGLALLGYMPAYAIALVGYLWIGPKLNLLALVPTLADQLLLAVLYLGLLAIPAERAQQRLRDAALRDPLTGVWNRAGFELQSQPLIAPGATVLAMDLDHFKQINDRHGHLAGDKVLRALAMLAGAEVASLGGEFGRLGGDEFLAVLPASRAPYAQACARQIHEACRRYAAGMPDWTISIGFAQVEAGETDLRDALQRADRALYRAKVDGRDKLFA